VHTNPFRGLVAGTPFQDVDGGERRQRAGSCISPNVLRRIVGAKSKPHAVEPGLERDDLGDRRKCFPRRWCERQRVADAERGQGLAFAARCSQRALALASRETADDDPHEQQQQQGQPLLRIGDEQRVEWPGEEKVVEQERPHRRHDGAERPGRHRRRDHREQVGGRRVAHAGGALQHGDEQRSRGQPHARYPQGDPERAPPGPGLPVHEAILRRAFDAPAGHASEP
jgi:hypothetical protein